MLSFRMVLTICILILSTSVLGCTNGKSPVSPGDENRGAQSFSASWELFGGDIEYNEIDFAPVLWGQDAISIWGPVGDPVLINDRHWCFAVTVEHDDNEDRIIYSILDDVDSADGGPAAYTGVLYNGGDQYEICSAKASAIYLDYEGTGADQVRLYVVCMVRDKLLPPEYPGGRIAVISNGWFTTAFPGPPFGLTAGFESLGIGLYGNFSPDIAHNYKNGDLHVVYTSILSEFPTDKSKLIYERCIGGSWKGPYRMFDEDAGHQQWIPRIAVGDGGLGYDDSVAVAYTEWSNDSTPTGIQLGAASWDAGALDPLSTAQFYHLPYDSEHPAGLPRIAMSPYSAAVQYTSIAFTQQLQDQTYQAVEVNNIRNTGNYFDYFLPIYNNNNTFGIFPSVTCHNSAGNPTVSLCYYEMTALDDWQVSYCRFNPRLLADTNPLSIMQKMYGSGENVQGILDPFDYASYLYIDTFRGSDIVAVDSGPFNQAFWVGWCDYVDDAATTVYTAFGDASQ